MRGAKQYQHQRQPLNPAPLHRPTTIRRSAPHVPANRRNFRQKIRHHQLVLMIPGVAAAAGIWCRVEAVSQPGGGLGPAGRAPDEHSHHVKRVEQAMDDWPVGPLHVRQADYGCQEKALRGPPTPILVLLKVVFILFDAFECCSTTLRTVTSVAAPQLLVPTTTSVVALNSEVLRKRQIFAKP